jgi:hypothetical protein
MAFFTESNLLLGISGKDTDTNKPPSTSVPNRSDVHTIESTSALEEGGRRHMFSFMACPSPDVSRKRTTQNRPDTQMVSNSFSTGELFFTVF